MLSKFNDIIVGKQFVGIELFTHNHEDGIALVSVSRKKSELIITHTEKSESLDQIKELPSKNDTVFLIINNTQVLLKEVDEYDKSEIKMLNKAFPNLKHDDFFYEISKIGIRPLVAIVRKTYVYDTLKTLSQKGIKVAGVSLGISSISQLTSFIEEQTVNTNSQTIYFSETETIVGPIDNGIVKTYEINGLKIHSPYLLGFSGILQLITRHHDSSGTIHPFNEQQWNDHYQKNFFALGTKAMVYSLLILLLLNFFIFNHYFTAVENTSANLEANKGLINNISAVKSRLKVKEQRLKNSLNEENSKSAFIINELIAPIPSSILLSSLLYQPLEKNIKEEEAIATKDNLIIISGKTVNNSAFTSWVEQIQKLKMVENVTITQFGKNEMKETVFTLKISILSHETK